MYTNLTGYSWWTKKFGFFSPSGDSPTWCR